MSLENGAGAWLTVARRDAPLVVSLPHTGTDLAGLEDRLVSPWLGRRDTDWHIETLYDFAADLGATVLRTAISRTVIDVNRDPSGASLYPGQTTTGLCPNETFDGDVLYRDGMSPDAVEITARRERFFDPYHAALATELDRLRKLHGCVVLYDCHSIRSELPRLFAGRLPVLNLGTNDGRSADRGLVEQVQAIMAGTGRSWIVDGRFKGGWITRHYGAPEHGIHALQMELANRGYLREPDGKGEPAHWPVAYDPEFAAPMRETLRHTLNACIEWAGKRA